MAKRTINSNMLTPGKTFMIRGKLTFSRVATQVAGDELVRDMQKRQQRRMNPIDKPYTTASICEAQIIYHPNPDGSKTNEDIYAEESLYQSTSNNATGWCFSGYNKGKALPWIGMGRNDGKGGLVVDQIPPEEVRGELASGLDVTLVMRVFASSPNQGVSMDGIIVNEPIRYYSGGSGAGLADYGITFNPAPGNAAPAASAPTAPAASAAPTAGTPVTPPAGTDPYSYPGASAAPTATGTYGYPSAPAGGQPAASAAPAPAPAAAPGSYGGVSYGQPPAPTPAAAAPAPGGVQYGVNYGGQPQAAGQAAAPFGSAAPAPAPEDDESKKGIRYNPTDRQY